MIEVEDMRGGYVNVVHRVMMFGNKVAPRGKPTRELLAQTILLHDPRDALPVGVGRGVSLPFAAVEAAQLVAGESHRDLVLKILPTMERFMDRGSFHGAYGPRVAGYLSQAERRLRADPDTRQAVLTIWSSELDLMKVYRDLPCTVDLQFMIRDGKLNLHAHMRSNDVWLGLAYDAFQFTQLQITMANVLELEVGQYFHHANSLHIYEDDITAAVRLKMPSLSANDSAWPGVFYPAGFFGRSMYETSQVAGKVLRDQLPWQGETATEHWYRKQLHYAGSKTHA